MPPYFNILSFLLIPFSASGAGCWNSMIQCTLYSCGLYTGCIYRRFTPSGAKIKSSTSTQKVQTGENSLRSRDFGQEERRTQPPTPYSGEQTRNLRP